MERELIVDDRYNLTGGEFNLDHSIVVDGCAVDVGTRVHTWDHPKGFDGYTTKTCEIVTEDRETGRKRIQVIRGPRYGRRSKGLASIRQFFVHHSGGDGDGAGNVYRTLYEQRPPGLSCHFVIDDDGTVWQFNDVVDRCRHAGKHNDCAVGVECSLYPLADERPGYYRAERNERTGNLPHEVVEDTIHGRKMRVFAFTNPQVEALARIAAGTWLGVRRRMEELGMTVPDGLSSAPLFPRTTQGEIPRTVYRKHRSHTGLIGHLQCSRNKIDPAGFPWAQLEERVADLCAEFEGTA